MTWITEWTLRINNLNNRILWKAIGLNKPGIAKELFAAEIPGTQSGTQSGTRLGTSESQEIPEPPQKTFIDRNRKELIIFLGVLLVGALAFLIGHSVGISTAVEHYGSMIKEIQGRCFCV